ncbi:MAG: hypothetical protein KAX05_01920 [Bacteroidales bacterium]|nr:hypothetical protein [Bacteroidales bacterium]
MELVPALDQPVTQGLYRISRHPQVLMEFILGCGICFLVLIGKMFDFIDGH